MVAFRAGHTPRTHGAPAAGSPLPMEAGDRTMIADVLIVSSGTESDGVWAIAGIGGPGHHLLHRSLAGVEGKRLKSTVSRAKPQWEE
jgi:hypothetical protein